MRNLRHIHPTTQSADTDTQYAQYVYTPEYKYFSLL